MHSVAANTLDALAADHDSYGLVASGELYDLLRESGIGPGTRVLDLAVRTGRASRPLESAGARVTGIAPSAAGGLPFGDSAFDAAIAADAFHLVDDQRAAFAELLRVVRRGGLVAIWFTALASDADLLGHRAAAARALGLEAVPEALSGGFRAFYATPFAERTLRVIPGVFDTTVSRWVGFERTRVEVREAYGERAEAWYDTLEAELVRAYGSADARLRVRRMQYVYLGRV